MMQMPLTAIGSLPRIPKLQRPPKSAPHGSIGQAIALMLYPFAASIYWKVPVIARRSGGHALREVWSPNLVCAGQTAEKFRGNPSPSGRRWPEGPDEGINVGAILIPSPAASRHPLPEGEGRTKTRLDFGNEVAPYRAARGSAKT